ncbi:hypothetical protein P186_0720 [Pyrobaculum ferrireducens]|uniref:Uncharacterized protein n=1 Tax=Pyrobaculum ferrireducens TaxID=1104324 RepID=G7VI78_9CREN|nr:hypothetical protein P186_0720 [Pyrobaculum ferrireducens]
MWARSVSRQCGAGQSTLYKIEKIVYLKILKENFIWVFE